MNIFYSVLFFSGIFSLLILLVLRLSKISSEISSEIYFELDKFIEQAEKATTKKELKTIHDSLRNFHKEKCVLRHYGEHARKIGYYIEGKYAGLNINK